jgi:predicted phage terminase large subunit-like protein
VHRLLQWWIDPQTGYAIPERSGVVRWFVRLEDDSMEWAADAVTLRARHGREPVSLAFVRMELRDNPALTAKDPDYDGKLLALPRVDRERLRAGNWNVQPAAGLVLDRGWFRIDTAAPRAARRVRYWDKAGTEGAGDWTAGVRLSVTPEGRWTIEDIVRGQWSALERNRVIRQVAVDDGGEVDIWLEQEPGSGGKESAEISIRELAGYVVQADRPTGAPVTRVGPLASQAEAGNVILLAGPWNEAFLREAHDFPEAARDDQVMAAAGAFNKLALGWADLGSMVSVLGGPQPRPVPRAVVLTG